MVKVVTDSTCDVPTDIAERLGITVLPMIVEVDGVAYQDGVTLTRQQFYDSLPTYATFPKTAAGSPSLFADAYRAARAVGADGVVSVHIARTVSGVCNAAELAASDVAGEGIPVRVVDSGSMTMGLGWLVITAAEMAQRGAALDEIAAALEAMKQRIRILAMADTLKYLRKSGRVSSLTAGIGELLQIKLLVELKQGAVTQLDRVRTRGRGVERLLDEVRKTPGKPRCFSIVYTGGDQTTDIERMRRELQPIAPIEPSSPVLVTPVIGAHFGPMGLGVVIVNE
ncbi:MAG: DegV family protein [Anaerolineae bacterium]|nr:DegV family protein [Candidatus Roseilinea sp.]MDW8448384.1 DegV family protein [Anaerolineae bacterium]